MGMNRGNGGESLVELEGKDKNCRHIIKNSRFKKNLKITLFCKEI